MSSCIVGCLLGAPCSGKSTISRKLEKEGLGVLYLGEILRNSTDHVIIETLARGNYVSTSKFIIPIITQNLKNDEVLILDGFPRNKYGLIDISLYFYALYTSMLSQPNDYWRLSG